MILRKLAFIFLGLLGSIEVASADESLLSHATYRESRSGAVLQFRPLDHEPAALTAQVFSLRVPNTDKNLPADITWTNGKNSFPLGTIRHTCTGAEMSLSRPDLRPGPRALHQRICQPISDMPPSRSRGRLRRY